MKNHAMPPAKAAMGLAVSAAVLAPATVQAAADASLDSGNLLINLILLGLAMFVLFRVLSGRRDKNGDQTQAPPRPDDRDDRDDDAPPQAPRRGPDMYANAQAAWDRLRSPDKRPPTPAPNGGQARPQAATPVSANAPAGSDEEFLAGAKMAYSRIAASLAGRDFGDLASFVSPAYLAELQNTLPPTPAGRPDNLLINAALADRRETPGRTVMVVDYDVLARQPGATENATLRERWTFSRDNAAPGANWLLDAMERR
jgi:predicted lipid-binding transport protein (Tim44 family)